eukprot:1541678-Rhodomonas_salina.2
MAIIDKPADRLALPLLSFKTENKVAKVMKRTDQEADPRNKPVVAVVCGTGGGKTRALEELRFGLLQQKGVLALAYTYNSGMEILQDVFERKFKIAEEDITSVLRKAMLDQEIMEDLHSGLVISLLAEKWAEKDHFW